MNDCIDSLPVASPVRWNHVPDWMIQRLLATFGPTSFGTKRGWYLFWYWAREHSCGTWWLDHWGSTIVGGLDVVVSEPYYPLTHDFRDVKAFAEMLGCELLIDAESEHCPGKTSRLLLMPKTGNTIAMASTNTDALGVGKGSHVFSWVI